MTSPTSYCYTTESPSLYYIRCASHVKLFGCALPPQAYKECQNERNAMISPLNQAVAAFSPLQLVSYIATLFYRLSLDLQTSKLQTYGVQGHPRSSILVSIESPYVTCYQSLIVTLAVSATVFEIFTVKDVKDRKLLILLTPPVFNAPQRRNAMRYRRNLYTAGKCI